MFYDGWYCFSVYIDVYKVSNCCLTVYLNIAGLWKSAEKCYGGPGNVLEFFCNQETGNHGLELLHLQLADNDTVEDVYAVPSAL